MSQLTSRLRFFVLVSAQIQGLFQVCNWWMNMVAWAWRGVVHDTYPYSWWCVLIWCDLGTKACRSIADCTAEDRVQRARALLTGWKRRIYCLRWNLSEGSSERLPSDLPKGNIEWKSCWLARLVWVTESNWGAWKNTWPVFIHVQVQAHKVQDRKRSIILTSVNVTSTLVIICLWILCRWFNLLVSFPCGTTVHPVWKQFYLWLKTKTHFSLPK